MAAVEMVTQTSVSSKHYAILALHATRALNGTRTNSTMTNIAPAHAGVNVLLGGAMLSCMLIMVVCICYLCHWRFQKTEARYERRHSWMQVAESDTTVHIFTLDQQACLIDETTFGLDATAIAAVTVATVNARKKIPGKKHDLDLLYYNSSLEECCDHSVVPQERETLELPPPGYADVVAMDKEIDEGSDPDLPSYETALKLSSRGYV